MSTNHTFKIGDWIGLDNGFILAKDNIENDQYESYKTKKDLLWDIQVRYGCSRVKPRTKRITQGFYSYIIKGEEGWRPEVILLQLSQKNISQFEQDFDMQISSEYKY